MKSAGKILEIIGLGNKNFQFDKYFRGVQS
jgi:hypothetical protein